MESTESNGARIYVLAKVSPGILDEFVKQAVHLEGVSRVSPVTGSYDVVVTVDEESHSKALKVVLKGIRNLPGIERTETLVEVQLE